MMAKYTIDEIRKDLEKMDRGLSEMPEAVMLLATTVVGANADKIAKFAGLPRSKCRTIAKRLRESGLWQGRALVPSNWLDKETGGIAFLMDVNVARGFCDRVPAE